MSAADLAISEIERSAERLRDPEPCFKYETLNVSTSLCFFCLWGLDAHIARDHDLALDEDRDRYG